MLLAGMASQNHLDILAIGVDARGTIGGQLQKFSSLIWSKPI
jgi:hypothetical protein